MLEEEIGGHHESWHLTGGEALNVREEDQVPEIGHGEKTLRRGETRGETDDAGD